MPILLTDIQVPVVERRHDYSSDYLCTLCDTSVGTDHNFRPEPHTLDECLGRLFELLKPTITREDVVPK